MHKLDAASRPRPSNTPRHTPRRSLLVFHPASASRADPRATPWRHYDSAGGNARAAARIAEALAPLVRVATAAVVPAPCPPQANGADCGLHVVVNAGAVAGALLSGDGGGWAAADAAVAASGTPAAAAAERERLRESLLAAWRRDGGGSK